MREGFSGMPPAHTDASSPTLPLTPRPGAVVHAQHPPLGASPARSAKQDLRRASHGAPDGARGILRDAPTRRRCSLAHPDANTSPSSCRAPPAPPSQALARRGARKQTSADRLPKLPTVREGCAGAPRTEADALWRAPVALLSGPAAQQPTGPPERSTGAISASARGPCLIPVACGSHELVFAR